MQNEQAQEFHTYVYAYALGCLDREDFNRLIEYTESSGSFPWQELGEYQNLAALLPSFLNIEQPAPNIKDKVARKLYRLKDAKRAPSASRPEAPKTAAPPVELPKTPEAVTLPKRTETPAPQPEPEEEITIPQDFKRVTSFSQRGGETTRPQQDTQVKARASAPEDSFRMPPSEPPADAPQITLPPVESSPLQPDYAQEEFIINQDGYGQPEPEPISAGPAPQQVPVTGDLETIRRQVLQNYQAEQHETGESPVPVRAGIAPKFFYTVVLILVAAIIGVYYLLSKQIVTTEKAAKEQVRTEIETAKLHNSKVIQASDLLESPYSQVITMLPQNRREQGFARLIVDTEKKTGFLILSGLEVTKPEMGYQLWMEASEIQRFGISRPNEFGTGGAKTELYQLGAMQELPMKGELTFYLTLEKGKETPGYPAKRRYLETKFIFPK